MSDQEFTTDELDRAYQIAVETVRNSSPETRLAAVYDWASNPDYTELGEDVHYGDAQVHVLELLTGDEVDTVEWVDGRYRREPDPA